MNYQSIRQAKAIEQNNKKRLLEVNPKLDEESGIYFLTRIDENGFKYAYIGQAVHILTRLAQHLVGYQHIDLSLKKHKLYSKSNPCGWKIGFLHFPKSELDKQEQHISKHMPIMVISCEIKQAVRRARARHRLMITSRLKATVTAYSRAERILQRNCRTLQKNTLKSKLERIKLIIRFHRNSMRSL